MTEFLSWVDYEGGIYSFCLKGYTHEQLEAVGLTAGQIAAVDVIKSHVMQIQDILDIFNQKV